MSPVIHPKSGVFSHSHMLPLCEWYKKPLTFFLIIKWSVVQVGACLQLQFYNLSWLLRFILCLQITDCVLENARTLYVVCSVALDRQILVLLYHIYSACSVFVTGSHAANCSWQLWSCINVHCPDSWADISHLFSTLLAHASMHHLLECLNLSGCLLFAKFKI